MRPGAARWLPLVLLVLLVAFAVGYRMRDPLSSPQIGAEDPYTHLVFVREHVQHGSFQDSERLGIGLYPPGMHAGLGALWVLSGADLFALARWGPAILFGALAASGTFALARRHAGAGAVAAGLAAWAVARGPEHAVRTQLLFPTGLDVALLPWILVGLAEALEGKRRGLATAGVLSLALVVAHPWIGFLIAAGGVAAASLAIVLASPDRVRARDAALVAGLLAGVAAVAAALELRHDADKGLERTAHICVVLAAVATLVILLFELPALARLRDARWLRRGVAAAGILAVAGAAWWTAAHAGSLPIHVSYPRMLGVPLIVLTIAGACAVLLRPTTGGLLGFGLVAAAWPVTVLGSWKWYFPHRTMVYLVAGAAVLAAPAAEAAVRAALPAARALLSRAGPALRSFASRPAPLAAAVAVALVLPTAGAMHVATPNAYLWDRYLPDDEFAVLDRLADRVDEADGGLVVVVGSWVPNAWLNAMLEEDHVAFRDAVYRDDEKREEALAELGADGATVVVLMDSFTRERADRKGWDLSFLDDWEVVDEGGDAVVYRRPAS